MLTLLGCGLRISELAGLRRRRVHLDRAVVQVVDTPLSGGRRVRQRFQGAEEYRGHPGGLDPGAGRCCGRTPIATRQRPRCAGLHRLRWRCRATARRPRRAAWHADGSVRGNFRRLYLAAVAKTGAPASALELGTSERRALAALRAGGKQTLAEVVERLGAGRRLRSEAVARTIGRLEGAELVVVTGEGEERRWAVEAPRPSPLAHLKLSGPHDLRHTYATWLEDAGIPARVIDAYMGHAGGRAPEQGSRIGRVYRATTDEMRQRVVAAVEERLAIVLKIAEERTAR